MQNLKIFHMARGTSSMSGQEHLIALVHVGAYFPVILHAGTVPQFIPHSVV